MITAVGFPPSGVNPKFCESLFQVTGNTVHMLLARIDSADTPPGAKGVSLFLVPNVMPDGTENDVEVWNL